MWRCLYAYAKEMFEHSENSPLNSRLLHSTTCGPVEGGQQGEHIGADLRVRVDEQRAHERRASRGVNLHQLVVELVADLGAVL